MNFERSYCSRWFKSVSEAEHQIDKRRGARFKTTKFWRAFA